MVGQILGLDVLVEDLEAARLVVRQRRRVVEAAGVHPHPAGAVEGPGPLDRGRQQMPADTHPDEVREQPEVGDLDVTILLALELEVARRAAAAAGDPGLDLGTVEPRHPPLVRPGQPAHPVPLAAHGGVEEAI